MPAPKMITDTGMYHCNLAHYAEMDQQFICLIFPIFMCWTVKGVQLLSWVSCSRWLGAIDVRK
ncbi:hypothetical protein BD779DRAFT_1562421 [Infundibulicybe gibba]|nr:hypothetical protein BD779DRAFT_1562421 [Infundibulicybe gibba]